MAEQPNDHGKSKYHRTIFSCLPDDHASITVDVYSVLKAFPTASPALDHCAKKVLCAGIRGKGNKLQDLKEARVALDRAIHIVEQEESNGN
jgi:hypothetical protein